jgi:hypothetical protein
MYKVNSSSFEFSKNIPLNSNAKWFMCSMSSSGSSSAAHPKLRSFIHFELGLFYRLGLSLHFHNIQSYSLPYNNFVQKVIPQVKNSMLLLLRTCKCPVFLKKLVLSQEIWGLLIHFVTIPISLQRGIHMFSYLLAGSINKERFMFSVYVWRDRDTFYGVSSFSRNDVFRFGVN